MLLIHQPIQSAQNLCEEIHLSGGDYNFYSNLLSSVQGEVQGEKFGLVWEVAGGASTCELCAKPWLICKNMFLLQTCLQFSI